MSVRNRIFTWALCISAAALPFSGAVSNIAIMLFALVWLIQLRFLEIRRTAIADLLLPALIYILYLAGMLYTSEAAAGKSHLERKLSFLVLPVLFAGAAGNLREVRNQVGAAFVIGTLAASCFVLIRASAENFRLNGLQALDLSLFSNQVLAGYLKSHATYLSLYIALALLFLADLTKRTSSPIHKVLAVLFALFLLGVLILLASRIVIVALAFFVFLMSVIMLVRKRFSAKQFVFSAAVLLIIATVIVRSEYLSDRFEEVLHVDKTNLVGTNDENGVSQRIFFWQNAWEIVKDNPAVGVGTGDAERAFTMQYDRLIATGDSLPESVVRAVRFFSENGYNAHNQYLQILIQFGLVGLALFLLYFGRSAYLAIRERDIVFLGFVVILLLACVTECVFDRQMGIVFALYINSFFVFQHSSGRN